MPALDETHDPGRRSWLASANDPGADFPIQNLPLAVFRRCRAEAPPSGGIGIGDRILDLAAAHRAGLFQGKAAEAAAAASAPTLNRLMALGPAHASALRVQAARLLAAGGDDEGVRRLSAESALVPLAEVELLLPAAIGDYTDFYASVFHATNVGKLMRPDNPLLPNYKWLPVGYHGRASSVVPSGTAVMRPSGQAKGAAEESPHLGPSRLLDYEVELGFFVGPGNALGHPVPIEAASAHIFGFCLLNDWSARDIQGWEYQPLGPFLGKSFATTVSPWVVTPDALAPFRAPAFARPAGDPAPLPYLASARDAAEGGIDITVEAFLSTARMREAGIPAERVSRGNSRDIYWTVAQMLAHHTVNGCNLNPGDLLASGTLSGPAKENWGSLLEITARGKEPLTLPGGETRGFLADGDEVVIRGRCAREGFVAIGFGECRGIVTAATGGGA